MATGIRALGLLCLLLLSLGAAAAPRVLLLNSYHPQYRWTAELTRGVQDALASVVPEENLHIEYMDGRRMVDDPAYLERISALLTYKYRAFRPDVVISSDDYAFNYLRAQHRRLFPGVPIVFCGVNVFDPEMLKGEPAFTGIAEGMEVAGNFDLIRHLQPGVQRIVLLADQTSFGQRMVRHAREVIAERQRPPAQATPRYEIWDNLTLAELWQRLPRLNPDDAVLMLAIHKDRAGQYFSFAEHLPVLTRLSPAPVYGMWGSLMIGHGVLGGVMNDPYQHGYATAQLARQVLAGTPPSALAIVPKAQFRPQVDYRVLQRFQIDEDRLPPDTTVYFRPKRFYELHPQLVYSAVATLIGLLLLVAILAYALRARARAQRLLHRLNTELELRVQERTQELARKNEELTRLNTAMERLAMTDTLTGLPNRRAGTRLLDGLFRRAQASGETLVLAVVDLDHFKQINDRFGHDVGDAVLHAVAQRLELQIRPSDRVCRWGGEEFLLLLPQTDQAAAHQVCDRLRQGLAETPILGVGRISVSIGLAVNLPSDSDSNALFKRADDALYAAKRNGRNQVIDATDSKCA